MKDCLRCTYYSVFYTKELRGFKRQERGECFLDRSIMTNHDTCPNFKSNDAKRRLRKFCCSEALQAAIYNIAEIHQILKEEKEEPLK